MTEQEEEFSLENAKIKGNLVVKEKGDNVTEVKEKDTATKSAARDTPEKRRIAEGDEAVRIAEEAAELITEKRLAYADLLKGKDAPVENPEYDYQDNAGIVVPRNFSQEPVDLNGRPFRRNPEGEFVDDDGKALAKKERKPDVDPALEELYKHKADIRAAFGDLHVALANLLEGFENDDVKMAYKTLDDAMGWFTR